MNWRADQDLANLHQELTDYYRTVDRREADADKRSAALVRVHEQGWKAVAAAIGKGLADIADAIRDHGRR